MQALDNPDLTTSHPFHHLSESSNMAKKMFTVLENNPEVMNHLAQVLGLDDSLSFYDVYSLTDPELLAFIPRPVYALLVIIPFTPSWHETREAEDKDKSEYEGKGEDESVLWFKQTIGNACGSIGLVHCLLNSEASKHIRPNSILDNIRKDALPKAIWERAQVLEDSDEFEKAHADAAKLGDTVAPVELEEYSKGQHFVAFVKAKDGHLWELEGGRMGPLDRGALKEDEDVLSAAALENGLGGMMRRETEKGGDLRFSVIALAKNLD
jgi:ubiquitin carboxyl-terminal hydrolase L3